MSSLYSTMFIVDYKPRLVDVGLKVDFTFTSAVRVEVLHNRGNGNTYAQVKRMSIMRVKRDL